MKHKFQIGDLVSYDFRCDNPPEAVGIVCSIRDWNTAIYPYIVRWLSFSKLTEGSPIRIPITCKGDELIKIN